MVRSRQTEVNRDIARERVEHARGEGRRPDCLRATQEIGFVAPLGLVARPVPAADDHRDSGVGAADVLVLVEQLSLLHASRAATRPIFAVFPRRPGQ